MLAATRFGRAGLAVVLFAMAGPASVFAQPPVDFEARFSEGLETLAERLQLELRGGGEAQSAVGGGSFRFAFARAPAMSCPGVEIAARAVAVIERKTQGANGHASEGLLGADLFKGFVVDVDYPNPRLTLHDAELFRYSGDGVELPVTFDPNDKWELQTALTLGDQRLDAKMIVDTGSRGTLGLTAPFTAQPALWKHCRGRLWARSG